MNTFWVTAPGATFVSGLIYQDIVINLIIGCGIGYWLYTEEQKRSTNE